MNPHTTQEDTSFPYDSWHTDKDTEARVWECVCVCLLTCLGHMTEKDGAGIPILAQPSDCTETRSPFFLSTPFASQRVCLPALAAF